MTDPDKTYNILNTGSGRWLSIRKNGDLFMKLYRKNCGEYEGGDRLDIAMENNPGYLAVEVGVDHE